MFHYTGENNIGVTPVFGGYGQGSQAFLSCYQLGNKLDGSRWGVCMHRQPYSAQWFKRTENLASKYYRQILHGWSGLWIKHLALHNWAELTLNYISRDCSSLQMGGVVQHWDPETRNLTLSTCGASGFSESHTWTMWAISLSGEQRWHRSVPLFADSDFTSSDKLPMLLKTMVTREHYVGRHE